MVVRPGRIPADEAAGHLRAAADCDLTRTRAYVRAADFSADAGLAAPATIAWGTGDRLLFPRQGERARERLPGAELVPLGGCGHIPTYDDPALVVGAVCRSARYVG